MEESIRALHVGGNGEREVGGREVSELGFKSLGSGEGFLLPGLPVEETPEAAHLDVLNSKSITLLMFKLDQRCLEMQRFQETLSWRDAVVDEL